MHPNEDRKQEEEKNPIENFQHEKMEHIINPNSSFKWIFNGNKFRSNVNISFALLVPFKFNAFSFIRLQMIVKCDLRN